MSPPSANSPDCTPESFFETLPICGPFSITAELPDMQMVIGYMEKKGQLSQGYYRLVRHPWYRQIQQQAREATGRPEALLYPSTMLALHAVLEYRSVQTAGRKVAVLGSDPERSQALRDALEQMGLCCVSSPGEADHSLVALEDAVLPDPAELPCIAFVRDERVPVPAAADFVILPLRSNDGRVEGAALGLNDPEWAETLYERNKKRGAVVSVRNLARLTGHDDEMPEACPDVREPVRQRLCELEKGTHGYLFSSGMHAVATMLDLLKKPGKNHVVVVGHVYSDTHFLMTEIPWPDEPMQVDFLDSDESERVAETLSDNTFAVFVETLTNPLNEVPDLDVIIQQAQARGIPVIIDNTMASPCNCQPLTLGANAVIHSTTKYLSGSNVHGGGAIVTSDPELTQRLDLWTRAWDIDLAPPEAFLLWEQMQDVEERMVRFNRNGLAVAEFLEQHPKVKDVYYCGLPSSPYFETASRLLTGCGSVVSFLLHEDSMAGITRFYDTDLSPIRKAPTLGSNITLMCPYTLLTYYQKSDDYLATIPLSRYLIRLAVGSEPDLTQVLEALGRGLDEV